MRKILKFSSFRRLWVSSIRLRQSFLRASEGQGNDVKKMCCGRFEWQMQMILLLIFCVRMTDVVCVTSSESESAILALQGKRAGEGAGGGGRGLQG